MTTLKNEIAINAPVDKIWAVLSDLALLEKYDPTVLKSELISVEKSGIGAKRKVYMKDGKNWFEEKITIWQPNQTLTIQLTNCTFPIKGLRHSYSFSSSGDNTIVKQVMEYEVKFGLLGKLMNWMMIKKQSDRGVKLFMDGLKKIVEKNNN
ncbi:MAG TPA: SRPBCC family protein [Flavipsychrobacter sp.]|nr:SRPBCC family protein [Flavipsychrobacter sp.]